jgi:hypothetical protein
MPKEDTKKYDYIWSAKQGAARLTKLKFILNPYPKPKKVQDLIFSFIQWGTDLIETLLSV